MNTTQVMEKNNGIVDNTVIYLPRDVFYKTLGELDNDLSLNLHIEKFTNEDYNLILDSSVETVFIFLNNPLDCYSKMNLKKLSQDKRMKNKQLCIMLKKSYLDDNNSSFEDNYLTITL